MSVTKKSNPETPAAHAAYHRFIAVLLTGVLLAACGSDDPEFETLAELPHGDATIRISWTTGSLAMAAAPIRISLIEGETERLLYEASIGNDGGALTLDNFRPVADRPPLLMLCLNGAEQADVSVRIDTNNGTIIESDQECAQ